MASSPDKLLPTRDVLDAVMDILMRTCSRPIAQSVLNVARQRAGVATVQITRDQLFDMLDPIERSLAFFLSNSTKAKLCRRDLEVLASAPSGPMPMLPGGTVIPVRIEDDILRARNEARRLAISRGFTLPGQTRIMTAVSELARNIVQYAGDGNIELNLVAEPAGIEITARDKGPGIPNLDSIMSGTYRSRLGMGLGLRGVKHLSERFEVRTEPGRGTTVIALLRMQ